MTGSKLGTLFTGPLFSASRDWENNLLAPYSVPGEIGKIIYWPPIQCQWPLILNELGAWPPDSDELGASWQQDFRLGPQVSRSRGQVAPAFFPQNRALQSITIN